MDISSTEIVHILEMELMPWTLLAITLMEGCVSPAQLGILEIHFKMLDFEGKQKSFETILDAFPLRRYNVRANALVSLVYLCPFAFLE
jgi:hypothetical protein